MVKGEYRLFGGAIVHMLDDYFTAKVSVAQVASNLHAFGKNIIGNDIFEKAAHLSGAARIFVSHDGGSGCFGSYFDANPRWNQIGLGAETGTGNWFTNDNDRVDTGKGEQIVYRREMPWTEAGESILQKMHILGVITNLQRRKQLVEEIDVIHASMKEWFVDRSREKEDYSYLGVTEAQKLNCEMNGSLHTEAEIQEALAGPR